jgi:photoactive yellow protein
MSCVPSQYLSLVPAVDRSTADAQPFGIVRVDDVGVIKLYNRWESEMDGVPVAAAEGRNFFTQVAPCTNNRLMFGTFKDGVPKAELDSEFNYTFTHKMEPTNVQIRLYRHVPSATNWVFVGLRAA